MPEPQISVLMPTYNQASFLRRAVHSLLAQTHTDWELLIIDDGSTDDTPALIAELRTDARIRDWRFDENRGLGYALNWGLAAARSPLLTYLPSDDLYFPHHLEYLKDYLEAHPDASLAYSGVRFHLRRTESGQIPTYPLQLVQVMHRRGAERWIERQELVSDDLERLFWKQLRPRGPFVGTSKVSCEWVDHPRQHHKTIVKIWVAA
jgi:glycosyltransferase involved in cell wall biosynthesis